MGGGACVGLVLRTRVPDDRYANKGSMVSNQETGFSAGVTTRDLAMSAIGRPDGGDQVRFRAISTSHSHIGNHK